MRNAARLMRAGAHSVKLEGGRKRLPMIEKIIDAEIPVMGHIGLTPSRSTRWVASRCRAPSPSTPASSFRPPSRSSTPAASPSCWRVSRASGRDGHGGDHDPDHRHRGRYAHRRAGARLSRSARHRRSFRAEVRAPLRRPQGPVGRGDEAFADDVRSGAFPNHEESYHIATPEAEELAGLYGSQG